MQIFIARGEDSSGPFTLEQVQDCLAQGTLLPEDLAYHEGLEGWIPLSELMDSIASPEPTVSGPLTKKAVLMGIAQRVFACLIIVGFFLPWCSDQSLRIAWLVDGKESKRNHPYSSTEQALKFRTHEQKESDAARKALSGASGLDLATKQYPDTDGEELMANPTLFLVPLLALVGAVVHKRNVYIGYPPLALISLFVPKYILGHTAFQDAHPVLWGIYLILVIVFITGIFMPKEGRSGEIVESAIEPKIS